MTESRPAGATLLSVLHVAGGAALLAGTFILVAYDRQIPTPLMKEMVPQWYIIIWLTLLGFWSLGAGIELWITRSSAWFLSTTFHLHLAIQAGVLLVQGFMKIDYLISFPLPVMILLGALLLVSLLIYFYLWRQPVIEAYDMEHTSIIEKLLPAVIIGAILVVAAHASYLAVKEPFSKLPKEQEVATDTPTRDVRIAPEAELLARTWMTEIIESLDNEMKTAPVASNLAAGPALWSAIKMPATLAAGSYEPTQLENIGFGNPERLATALVPIYRMRTTEAQDAFWKAVRAAVWPDQAMPDFRMATQEERILLDAIVPLSWRSKPLIVIEGNSQRLIIAFQNRARDWEAYFAELLPSTTAVTPHEAPVPDPIE